MVDQDATFGASLGSIFVDGVKGYLANIGPLTLAALLTLGTYLLFRFPAQAAYTDDQIAKSLVLDLVGLLLGSIVAYPWYTYALAAVDGQPIQLTAPLRDLGKLSAQGVASFWFWAGVLLGIRYLLGIPAILAVVFYAFYGFAIADGVAPTGLRALGYSVRLGEGKRVGLFALALLFIVFNLLGAIAVGYDVSPLTIGLAIAGLTITTSITMVSGARIYRLLQAGQAGRR